MPYACEEAALLRQRTAVRYHTEGVRLQAVVVVEAQRLVAHHQGAQLEAGLLEALPAPGMAAVEHGHLVLARHGVDGAEETLEVLLGVYVLLAVRGEEDIVAPLEAEALVDVAGVYLR